MPGQRPGWRPARRLVIALGCTLGLVLFAKAAALAEEPVAIFAAASTTDALSATIASFEQRSAVSVRPVFAASSLLAKQIGQGAPADLFLSANQAWMDHLTAKGLLDPDSHRPAFGNRLVLIAPASRSFAIDIEPGFALPATLGNGRLAIGDPAHVPAGGYAKAALESLGVWQALKPRLALAGDARAALTLVARGEAAAGVVYVTDAAFTERVRVVGQFPATSHPPIVYPLAVITGRDRPAVRAFYDYLVGAEALAIFHRFGFEDPPAGD